MKSTQHGFTLLELMAALTVLAVLVGLATPSFKHFSANSRTSAGANNLMNAFAIARSEALHQGKLVAVCASGDSQTCNTTDWSSGWIVFTDASGNPGVLDSSDVLLQAWPAPAGGVTVTVLNNTENYVRFDARGMKSPVTSLTFKITASGCTGNNASQVAVTASGSPQSTKVACP
jgi:prepilin-type N-terminal cleavage/methylation domain-containing protein